MDQALTDIWNFLGNNTELAILFAVWIGIYRFSKSIFKDAWLQMPTKYDSTISQWLKEQVYWKKYQGAVRYILSETGEMLDRRAALVRGETYAAADDPTTTNIYNRNAWSWGLLDFTLFMALAYPPLSLILQWMLFGHAATLGSLMVIEPNDSALTRIFMTALLLTAFGVGLYTRALLADETKRTWRLKIISAVAWGLLFTIGFRITGSDIIAVTGVGVAAALCALFFQGTGAVPGAGTTFALGSAAIGLATAGHFQLPGQGEFTVLMGAGAAVIMGVTMDRIRIRTEARVRNPIVVLLAFLAMFYVAILIAAVNQEPVGKVDEQEILATLLFFGMLPIANAVADWLSIGLTRFLLSRGSNSNPFFWAIADVLLACVCFFVLGGLMIVTVFLIEHYSGNTIINLPLVLGEGPGSILQDYSNYIWVYFTFLSTLLPTVIHAMVGIVTLVLVLNRCVREKIYDNFKHDSVAVRNLAGECFCAFVATVTTLMIGLLCVGTYSLFFRFPELGKWIVEAFRWFAVSIGAI